MSKPQVRVGVCVIIVRHGKVLLGKRLSKLGTGTWSCPGGHLEFGETVEAGGLRECLEETGLIPRLTNTMLPWNQAFYPSLNRQYVTCYVAGIIGEDEEPELMEPDKFECWKWFSLEDLKGLPLLEQRRMRVIIEQVIVGMD